MDIETGAAVVADCPICLQALPGAECADYDSRVICGDQLFGCSAHHVCHAECVKKWVKSRLQDGFPVTCPLCRSLVRRPFSRDIPVDIRRSFEPQRPSHDCSSKCALAVFTISSLGMLAYTLLVINNKV